jgi:hypothetical protein
MQDLAMLDVQTGQIDGRAQINLEQARLEIAVQGYTPGLFARKESCPWISVPLTTPSGVSSFSRPGSRAHIGIRSKNGNVVVRYRRLTPDPASRAAKVASARRNQEHVAESNARYGKA